MNYMVIVNCGLLLIIAGLVAELLKRTNFINENWRQTIEKWVSMTYNEITARKRITTYNVVIYWYDTRNFTNTPVYTDEKYKARRCAQIELGLDAKDENKTYAIVNIY